MSADLYAKLHGFLTYDEDRFTQAELTAAVLVVLEMHEPDHIHAGVGYVTADKCVHCDMGEPLAVFKDYLNGSARKVTMHCHGLYNWCAYCPGADDYPCPPVLAICEALAVVPS